jgi:hypothetical protein
MPIWTWGTNTASGYDPFGAAKVWPWNWQPTDDLGQPLFAPGNYEATVGWKDTSVIGGGENKRIFGYKCELSFDWDGFIFDRVGSVFPSTPGRSINRGWSFGALLKRANTLASMVSGFDGDANLVFANRFDYQYFGSKLNLTRRCDPTEITITNLDKGIAFSYVLLFLYFTLSVTAQVMVRLHQKTPSQPELQSIPDSAKGLARNFVPSGVEDTTSPGGVETPSSPVTSSPTAKSIASFSNKVMQPFLADGVCLGLLKWWDERCMMLIEIKKEYNYLEKKIKKLEEPLKNMLASFPKITASKATLGKNHIDAAKIALKRISQQSLTIYTQQLIKEATEKSATSVADFNAKIFSKQKKIPT